MKTTTDTDQQMNQKKITAKQTQLIAVAIIAASVITAAMIIGANNGQNLQKVMAQGSNSSTTASSTAVKTVSPTQSTNKEFWINTVHLDGMTNTHVGMKCD